MATTGTAAPCSPCVSTRLRELVDEDTSNEQRAMLPRFLEHVTTAAAMLPLVDEWASRTDVAPQPGLELRASVGVKGAGVFTTRPFVEGEIVCQFGSRRTASEAPFLELIERFPVDSPQHKYSQDAVQLDVDLYALPERSLGFLVNHSCCPTTYFRPDSQGLSLVALRRVSAGEEVTYDYSTIVFDEYTLHCREENCQCRGFAGNPAFFSESEKKALLSRVPPDKLTPVVRKLLRTRYDGFFSEKKIMSYHEGSDLRALVSEGTYRFDPVFTRQCGCLAGERRSSIRSSHPPALAL
eukprot:m51a1_g11291 hypothetical protein (296) ;mRNA; f:45858-46745